jgi:MFS family permease
LGWIFSLAIVFLGLSATFGGKWLEKVGPRLTMFVAACCFGGGFLVSALGVYLHISSPKMLTSSHRVQTL